MSTPAGDRRVGDRPPREGRRRSREAALQMLYQSDVGRVPMDDVRRAFFELAPDDPDALDEEGRRVASRLAEGVSATVAALDPVIAEAAEHWRLDRMQVMDRLILRLAVYELLHHPETPAAVIINEALELARTFSGGEAVRFVNGVLEGVRRRLDRA